MKEKDTRIMSSWTSKLETHAVGIWKRFCSSIRTHFDYPRVSQPRAHIHFLSRICWLVIAIWWWPSQPLKENMLSPNGWAFIWSSFFLYVGNNMLRHKPTFVKKKEDIKWRIFLSFCNIIFYSFSVIIKITNKKMNLTKNYLITNDKENRWSANNSFPFNIMLAQRINNEWPTL